METQPSPWGATRLLLVTGTGIALIGAIAWSTADPAAPIGPTPVAAAPELAAKATARPVSLANSQTWLQQLRSKGAIRFQVGDKAVEVSQQPEELGALTEHEKLYVYDCLQQRVRIFRNRLEAVYAREDWSSQEERELAEAKAMAILSRYDDYEMAFREGQYFMMRPGDPEPPLGPNVRALHTGARRAGEDVKLIILLDQQKTQVAAMEAHVARLRHSWLGRVCHDFNQLGASERSSMLERLAQRDTEPSDAEERAWRKRHFPKGIRIDEQTQTIYIN